MAPVKKLNSHILLDIGCGSAKHGPNWVGLDKRYIEGIVDICHDIESTPLPVRANSCKSVRMSHVVEYIDPRKIISVFDDIWRMLCSDGFLIIEAYYTGNSEVSSDPEAFRHGLTEDFFSYFDIRSDAYKIYRPKPYIVSKLTYTVGGDIYVEMSPVKNKTGA